MLSLDERHAGGFTTPVSWPGWSGVQSRKENPGFHLGYTTFTLRFRAQSSLRLSDLLDGFSEAT